MANDKETNRIKKILVVKRVKKCYSNMKTVLDGFQCMFKEKIETLCKIFTQYPHKWVASCTLVTRKENNNKEGT